MFKTVKKYYDKEMPGYTNEGVKIFVIAGWITEKEYKEITGVAYAA